MQSDPPFLSQRERGVKVRGYVSAFRAPLYLAEIMAKFSRSPPLPGLDGVASRMGRNRQIEHNVFAIDTRVARFQVRLEKRVDLFPDHRQVSRPKKEYANRELDRIGIVRAVARDHG
jgi:hypothetical protein